MARGAPAVNHTHCWPVPRPFFEPPFNEALASVVWSRPLSTAHGPLDDVLKAERERLWPAARVQRLLRILPPRAELARKRFGSCAVVGSSPELLLYSDGKDIDGADAVFRANLAVTQGFEAHAGTRTNVRVVNPVESVRRARSRGGGARDEIIIKNQDPPAIRSPSNEHGKFLSEAEQEPTLPNFMARRAVLELCNYMMLAAALEADVSTLHEEFPDLFKQHRPFNLSTITAAFRGHVAGRTSSWHPQGDGIPRFSPLHCSTGTILLVQALLTCRAVTLYGYHACSCVKKCADPSISERNHYWDSKRTPLFSKMMQRYAHHMRFYQLLEGSCDLDFRIARHEHCDRTASHQRPKR